ncbi:hypothetical protein AFL01nite_27950 [Aeromicrobium flavum]|uniref:Uncharacterized protein n=1 Tax=Aeromicrobium flavum TaxID=416568 RepID=A0A512HYE7_9ACTN|nr:hypothetical protein [Aeromicrobium flavum]GEO90468.1 hypothetical protein AFL01nite_27950 [Aeromicrobium flavum]
MNHIDWQRVRRTALVLACATYFGTLTVIGQVADGGPVPEPPAQRVEASR